MPRAYYNEIDPAAAAILRELVVRDVIPQGDVDTRSIKEVTADDVRGYTQAHFFAGGGLWPVAGRLAGWPDDRRIWTGSCPCQGESLAGKRLGADDPRHLWPDFFRLISACRPPVIMGEQVAAAAGTHWLDGVCVNLEAEDYSARAVDIPACAVDAPHQRNRLYWVAVGDGGGAGWQIGPISKGGRRDLWGEGAPLAEADAGASRSSACLQSNAHGTTSGRYSRSILGPQREGEGIRQEYRDSHNRSGNAPDSLFSHAASERRQVPATGHQSAIEGSERPPHPLRNGSWWADAEWIVSPLDGKARRAKPGIPFLVDGLPGRVDLWRIGGNAISPILAAEVIAAFLESEDLTRSQGMR